MQKLINAPDAFVEDVLSGIIAAHPEHLRVAGDPRAVVRFDAPVRGKVAIATGGGSGHLPIFLGYVGRGFADGAAVGNVFASPSSEEILAVTRAVDGGKGVLYLFGNYGGDTMNFGMAADLAAAEGIEVSMVRAADDVASAPRSASARRRGIAGIYFLYKVAGAKAEEGGTLAEVTAVAEKAAANLVSMGVALAPCTVPAAGRPTFDVRPGEMEIGMGLHGEPGVRRGKLQTADEVTTQLVETLLADLEPKRGDRIDVLVNGLGATPVEELYIMFRKCRALLEDAGLHVRRARVGEYATSLEMVGASISLLRVDDELARLMDAPAHSPILART